MTEPVNNKVEVITRFEKGKPNTYSFDGGKTFIDKLPVNNQWLTEILVSYRNGTINPDPRKWATSDSNDLELAEQAILSKLESIEQEAYKRGFADGATEVFNKYSEKLLGELLHE